MKEDLLPSHTGEARAGFLEKWHSNEQADTGHVKNGKRLFQTEGSEEKKQREFRKSSWLIP